jgi:O-antigen ligase
VSVDIRAAHGRSVVPAALVTSALGLLAVSVVSGTAARATVGLVVFATILAVTRPVALGWPRLVAGLILIILFIPIRRYTLPGSLPFQLEPYRLFVAVLVLGWFASLLVDQRTRFRRTGFEGPLLLIVGSALASVMANPGRVAQFSTEVNKSLMFLLSYVLLVYVIASVVRRHDTIDFLTKTLVAGGGVVAVVAIVEARIGFNLFNHLSTVMPFLQDQGGDVGGYQRLGTAKNRVFASAQHPIALSAALVMLIPFAVYLARRYGQRRWIGCAMALGIASSATISRTGIMMFVVVAIVFLWLRPRETRRLWPLVIPALIAIHFVLPGTLGAIKQSFLPAGGLLAEQHASANTSGSGRLADLGPALTRWQEQPLLGEGYGTQVVDLSKGGIDTNIFDDQWLGTLLATGAVGFFGWLWFFVRAVRKFGSAAKKDDSERGWLLTCVAAGVAAYGIGMLTYDAFAFVQVTFLLFIFVGLGSALLAERSTPLAMQARRRRFSLARQPVRDGPGTGVATLPLVPRPR